MDSEVTDEELSVRVYKAHVAHLAEVLENAAIDMRDWAAYAGDYFMEKHDIDGDCAALNKEAAVLRRMLPREGG